MFAGHELRAPLATLQEHIDMMPRIIARDSGGLEPDHGGRIAQIINTCSQQLRWMDRMILDLVDAGRLESGKLGLEMEVVDLAALLEQVVEEARLSSTAIPIQLALPESGEPLHVRGDRVRVGQVIMNLPQNAFTHASESERIDVRLGREESGDGQPMARIEIQLLGMF